MARRRRDEPKPDLGFEIPEFDEAEFIRKETISFRTTLILFLYSVLTAIISFLVWTNTGHSWFLSLLIGAALGFLLVYIFRWLKVDIAHFKKKEWTGTAFLYGFSWLAFFIFFTNPPIYDGTGPVTELHITPDVQEPGGPVQITFTAADNVAIDPDSLRFVVTGPGGSELVDAAEVTAHGDGVWTWRHTFGDNEAGTYTVRASIADTAAGFLDAQKQRQRVDGTVTIGDVLRVDLDNNGNFTNGRNAVIVTVPARLDVYRAWLQFDNGTTMNMQCDADLSDVKCGSRPSDEGNRVYIAQPGFAGFALGENTFRVHVQEHESYLLAERHGLPAVDADLVSRQSYTVTIEDPELLGDKSAKPHRMREAFPARTPGFDVLVTVTALGIGLALVAHQRRR